MLGANQGVEREERASVSRKKQYKSKKNVAVDEENDEELEAA